MIAPIILIQVKKKRGTDGAIFQNPNTGKPRADEQVATQLLDGDVRAAWYSASGCVSNRHTFATLTTTDGVNAVWVGRQMGHASLRRTRDVYAKWIDKADRGRERDKASVAFRGAESAALCPMR